MDPEGCLRSLTAEALWWAHPDRPLFPVSLGVMAVANAFVMLGLLPEPLAEAILAEHRSALERQGFGDGWGVTPVWYLPDADDTISVPPPACPAGAVDQ